MSQFEPKEINDKILDMCMLTFCVCSGTDFPKGKLDCLPIQVSMVYGLRF